MNSIYAISISGSNLFSNYSVEGYITSTDDDTINNALNLIARKYNITFNSIERRYGFIRTTAINCDMVLVIEAINKIA